MQRYSDWRLKLASYPFAVALQTRFQDLDPLGHINHAAQASLFETARIHFTDSIGLKFEGRPSWLIAGLHIDYLAEAYFPHDILIATGCGRIGNRSLQLLSAAFQSESIISVSEATIVLEPGAGRSISDDVRKRALRHMVNKDAIAEKCEA